MKSLYESILSSTNSGQVALFQKDEQVRRIEIVKLIVKLFKIQKMGEDDEYNEVFVGKMGVRAIDKSLKELENALKRYNYFDNVEYSSKINGGTIRLSYPIKDYDFRDVTIEVRKPHILQPTAPDYKLVYVRLSDDSLTEEMGEWWKEVYKKL